MSGWRCFADAIAVEPFQEGLNVIHAPNATGKSTLFEALRRGLIDSHRVGGEEIKKVRSWGRSLAPTVHVDFSHDGTEYRISKKFLDEPKSILYRKENGRFVSLAESDKADEMVRKMINGNPPAKGLSKPDNWGLAQVLWAPQGELALSKLSGSLMNQIRDSLGAQVAGPTGNPIEGKIKKAYLEIFTPTGKDKAGSKLLQLRENLSAAIDERNDTLEQQREYEEAARKVEDLRNRQKQAKRNAEALGKNLNEARTRAEEFRKLTSEKNQRAESVRAEEARLNELKGQIEAIAATRKEIEDASEVLRKIEFDLPQQERELQQREKDASEAKSTLENIRKERPKVDAARALADKARQFVDNARILAGLDDLIQKISTAQESLNLHKKEHAELIAPTEKELRTIFETIKKKDELKLRIEASQITLEIVPEKDGSLTVISGEETGEVDLNAGIPTLIKGSPEVVADFPDCGRIRASGPSGSFEEFRSELAETKAELSRLIEPYGTSDVESLETLLYKKRDLTDKINAAQTQIDTWLSGQTLDYYQHQQYEIQAVQDQMIRDYPKWQNQIPDPPALKAEAEEISNSFTSRIDAAEPLWMASEKALVEVSRNKDQLASQAEAAIKTKEFLEFRLAGLISDGIPDEQRAEKLKETTFSWDAARLKLEELEKRLAQFTDDPVDTLNRLEKQYQAAEEAAGKARDDEKTEEGKLHTLGARGTYSLLTAAEEKVASIQAEVSAEELHAGAIHLLYDTLTEVQNQTLAAVAGPVETTATQIFQRIAGLKLGDVKLGDSFEAANVIPEISAKAVPLESVSGGEKEQIHLATRLALAEVLAKEERQMVVLDDVMTFTDAGRMARVMSVLEEEAQRLQIIILTCHPERYGGLEGANFVDLEAVVSG